MLLAADVGNTEIVLGVFRGDVIEHTWRLSTRAERTSDEFALTLQGFLQQRGMSLESHVTGLVVASVVPDVTATIREMSARYFPFSPVIVGPGVKTGVPILTDNPREVGADRVVNALAAFTLTGGPAIVVDFGTATNFDVVSAKGEFVGGVIAPGMQASAASLFSRTARLTRVELSAPPHVVGKSTVEAIQSGLIFGTAGEVDAIVTRIKADLPGAIAIATGGLAPVVIPHCSTIDREEPWLTLEGLRLVFERNTVMVDE
ncbi:MAG: type III pantothenate kinase [Actinomycetota bacterium]|nr:type III pantothenate kinase [Actinomycetota bacterium]MDH5223165.1 type III pantothenate kinase [Actinomycetota bacterium]MDH5312217.1 type III pantothenate kinase [Actinomycetota bacterium]